MDYNNFLNMVIHVINRAENNAIITLKDDWTRIYNAQEMKIIKICLDSLIPKNVMLIYGVACQKCHSVKCWFDNINTCIENHDNTQYCENCPLNTGIYLTTAYKKISEV